jgi:CubicO group peptidase (beta-lactamase class C family)
MTGRAGEQTPAATATAGRVRAVIDPDAIDRLIAPLDRNDAPGGAIGIAVHGEPVYRRGFGLANLELAQPVTPSMRLRIGSISKHFTALAYLLLCEEGRADIDDPIGRHLPELHPVARRVTARQLMGNISGLRDVHDIRWQFSGTGRAVTSAELLTLYNHIDDVAAPPASTWRYNNGGWLLLSAAIERIADCPLEQVFDERIFTPVGMHATLLRRWDSDFVTNSATLHTPHPGGGFFKGDLGSALAGEGGIVSTVDDMLRWLAHMDAPVVGRSSSWQAILAPQTLSNGMRLPHGSGLIRERYRGVETIHHPGGVLGGSAQIIKVPEAGLDLVVMINRGDLFAITLADQLIDLCLTGLAGVEHSSAGPVLNAKFYGGPGSRFVRVKGDGVVSSVSIDGVEMPAFVDCAGIYWPEGRWYGYPRGVTSVTLIGDPARPESIRLNEFGNCQVLPAVDDVADADASIVGIYRWAPGQVEAEIVKVASGLVLQTRGAFGAATYRLQALSHGVWQATQNSAMLWGGILSFEAETAGFHFSGYTNRNLPFRRVVRDLPAP